MVPGTAIVIAGRQFRRGNECPWPISALQTLYLGFCQVELGKHGGKDRRV